MNGNPVTPFDALEVGASWRSDARTLTEAELALSCMLTGDWHPIHADQEFARTTAVGQRIFHGMFGTAIAFGMATRFPPHGAEVIAALGLREWRFLAPLVVGDTVHVEVQITAKRATSDGRRGIVERRIRLVKHGGEVAQEGIASTLVHRGEMA